MPQALSPRVFARSVMWVARTSGEPLRQVVKEFSVFGESCVRRWTRQAEHWRESRSPGVSEVGGAWEAPQ